MVTQRLLLRRLCVFNHTERHDDPRRVTTHEPSFVAHVLPEGRRAPRRVVSERNKKCDVLY